MKDIYAVLLIFLAIGLLTVPASASHWQPGDGNPAEKATQLGNPTNGNNAFSGGVFEDGWSPLSNDDTNTEDETESDESDDDQTEEDSDDSSESDEEADLGVCVIGVDSPCNAEEYEDDDFSDDTSSDESSEDSSDDETGTAPDDDSSTGPTVTEEAYIERTPTPGEPYFEAMADDGSWISYVNPRDEYNAAYSSREEAPGSGKVCMTLLNQNGEPIVGESIPGTQASMDMEGLEWHSYANPFTVNFPLTSNYARPLDSDQFGTSPDLPQGDGYLDSHCFEFHQVPADHTVGYDPVEITGPYADSVEVVGYYDQTGTWNSNFDPETDVSPYGTSTSSDGTVTMSPGNSHTEILVVLRLTGEGSTDTGSSDNHDYDVNSGQTPPAHTDPDCHYHHTSDGGLAEHCTE